MWGFDTLSMATTTPRFQLPAIHLNGTGRENLSREYKDALLASRALEDALCAATCHQRDFYPLGEEAFKRARREREEAFQHLQAIQHYLQVHYNHVRAGG